MIRHSNARSRRSRIVGNLFVLLAAAGLSGGIACSSSDDVQKSVLAEQSPLVTTIRVPAGQISQQVLGAAAFDVTLDTEATGGPIAKVRAVDATGGFVGELSIDGPSLESGATYLARDGSSATVSTSRTDVAGYTAHTVTYRANGAFLAITEEKVADQTIGLIHETGNELVGTTTSTSLPPYGAKQYAGLVQDWAANNPDLPVLDATHAARDLHVIMLDSAWAVGLQTLITGGGGSDGGVASKSEAMHKGVTCQGLFNTVASGAAGVVCGLCATAAAALPPSAGWSAILAIPSCAACAAVLGGSLINYFQCVYSESTRFTQQYCADNAPAWADGTVSSDEHSCVNTCNIEKCSAYCQASGQVGNSCLKNQCRCRTVGTGGTGFGGSGGVGGVGGFWGFGGAGGFGAFAGFGGGSGSGGSGGSPPCQCSGQCTTISCPGGVTMHCSGPCPTGYDCQFGGCVKTTVEVCDCDGSDPPGPCTSICQD